MSINANALAPAPAPALVSAAGQRRRAIVVIAIYNSTDDPHIPISEARHVAAQLKASYFEFTDRGHFTDPRLPEVVDFVRARCASGRDYLRRPR